MAEPCSIANQHCRASANLDPEVPARGVCYACGENVCSGPGCSTLTTQYAQFENPTGHH